jgi:hypothetical protein
MPKLFCHPANIQAVQSRIEKGEIGPKRLTFSDVIEIHTNEKLPRESPTGRFVLPDGTRLDRENFTLRTRFITYGPEDIDHLVWIGAIKEEYEMHFYLVDDSFFKMSFDYGPVIMPKSFLFRGTA